MTEPEYLCLSNLAKVRTASTVVQTVTFTDSDWRCRVRDRILCDLCRLAEDLDGQVGDLEQEEG